MYLPDLIKCKIAIIGIGYVGLPLAIEFASVKTCNRSRKKLNRSVIGYDLNKIRISQLKSGIDITQEVKKSQLENRERLTYTLQNT